MKYGKLSNDALRNAIAYSSADDIDIRRMADEISITRDREHELRAWARNRLSCCEAALTGRNGDLSTEQVSRHEQERRTLQSVIRLIDGEPTPDGV